MTRQCARLVVVAALLLGSGCTAKGRPSDAAAPSGTPPASPAPAPSRPPPWPLADVRVDRIAGELPLQDSLLPATFPPDDSVLPDLLTDPPGRARLAYHPRESFDDRGGWVTERVLFLGLDGAWRSLEMVDLGLPESTHPGVDTYGAGELSPDGRTWAAPTVAGIVLLDLSTARWRVLRLPGDHTRYLKWRPDGRRIDVVRLHGASTQRTWSVDPLSPGVDRAPYLLPIDGFAHDGSVVTFARRDADTVRIVHRDRSRTSDVVAMPYRHARRGGAVGSRHVLFGLNRELLAVDGHSWAPVARLQLRRTDAAGWPRGWWDEDSVWFAEASRGLITWNVSDGRTRVVTRVGPAARHDTYWSASVAVDLMR
jgi:hypothetical protein